jgi:hypothetical protein
MKLCISPDLFFRFQAGGRSPDLLCTSQLLLTGVVKSATVTSSSLQWCGLQTRAVVSPT